MLFNSFAYVIFLPIVFAAYWLIKDEYRWVLLLVSSYFFYMCSGPKYGLLILSVTFASYVAAIVIEKYQNKKKLALVSAILVCMGILFFFKYFNFFSKTISELMSLLGIKEDYVTLNIILPVGISFYTFQTMSYVIDVYKGITKAEHHFGKFAAFVSFFPQLVAGPIERSNNLLPQIKEKHIFDYDKAMMGVKLMLWGYYKKLVIADGLAEYVQRVFDNPHEYTGFALIIASLFFTLQIYCDFSGYSDIAIGTAKLFGIDLMTNFKSPYFSESIREFWSRWHISLSTWFRDYVYIPLGGNRVSRVRHYVNLMITFLVSGLWHGADWTFVTWGGIHGLAQVAEDVVIGKEKTKNAFLRVIRSVLVFGFCSFAWIFFVSHSISDAFYVISHCLYGIGNPIVYLNGGLANLRIGKSMVAVFGTFIFIMAAYDYISLKKDFIEWISSKNKIIQRGFYLLVGLIVVFFSKKGVAAEFIYFQF